MENKITETEKILREDFKHQRNVLDYFAWAYNLEKYKFPLKYDLDKLVSLAFASKDKEIAELKEDIELWKNKYHTAQKAFCEHNDRMEQRKDEQVQKAIKEIRQLGVRISDEDKFDMIGVENAIWTIKKVFADKEEKELE